MGEIFMRGNLVMKGYLKNPKTTEASFAGGWFHSGDLGVIYPDGYLQLKDRAKDIIISGGENISSIEVEEALYRHPSVEVAAVVAMPHEKWGEQVHAIVVADGIDEATVIAHCKARLGGVKAPKSVAFVDAIPRTAAGKMDKKALRIPYWGENARMVN